MWWCVLRLVWCGTRGPRLPLQFSDLLAQLDFIMSLSCYAPIRPLYKKNRPQVPRNFPHGTQPGNRSKHRLSRRSNHLRRPNRYRFGPLWREGHVPAHHRRSPRHRCIALLRQLLQQVCGDALPIAILPFLSCRANFFVEISSPSAQSILMLSPQLHPVHSFSLRHGAQVVRE